MDNRNYNYLHLCQNINMKTLNADVPVTSLPKHFNKYENTHNADVPVIALVMIMPLHTLASTPS